MQVYANTESPYMLAKGPKTVVSSSALKSQYSQTYSTTLSPLQMKYLNSPQYLAQNYNTIQSSQIYSKGSAFPGVKSTVSPPLKSSLVGAGSNAALISASQSSGSSSGAYLNNYSSASNHSPLIQPYKNLAIRNYSI